MTRKIAVLISSFMDNFMWLLMRTNAQINFVQEFDNCLLWTEFL